MIYSLEYFFFFSPLLDEVRRFLCSPPSAPLRRSILTGLRWVNHPFTFFSFFLLGPLFFVRPQACLSRSLFSSRYIGFVLFRKLLLPPFRSDFSLQGVLDTWVDEHRGNSSSSRTYHRCSTFQWGMSPFLSNTHHFAPHCLKLGLFVDTFHSIFFSSLRFHPPTAFRPALQIGYAPSMLRSSDR